ncbi:MAG: hypothetical protein ACRENE_18575, partial [Polyangiaceae bacterium]
GLDGGDGGATDATSPLLDAAFPSDGPLPEGAVPDCATPADDNAGVFVTPGGNDVVEGSVCGLSRSSPCKTIGAGLSTAASTSGRSIVYVAAGTYVEKLTLASGVTVEGGWQVGGEGGTDWTYACSAPETLTFVQAPSSATTTVVASSGASTLTTLTIHSKATAGAGESLYGVAATGASTQLTLNDVVIVAATAGDGANGATGTSGAAPASSCSPGDGASATTLGTAGAAAHAGAFSSAGFAPGGGTTGGSGGAADNGTAGGTGTTTPYGSCTVTTLIPPACTDTSLGCVGGPGKPGCAGGGGAGGGGGSGGGSSVGLFVSGAHVTLNGGSVSAGAGGRGGAGGGGGAGATGSAGSVGSTTTCTIQVCGTPIPNVCQGAASAPFNVIASGGAAGGTGGTGSNGGAGGGGAGGDSFAVVTAASGTVVAYGSPGTHVAAGGTGSGGAPAGTYGALAHF